MEPLVSVVVATYQRAGVLAATLGSVLAQSYRTLEVLVEDDGSTDGSGAVVAALGDPRIHYAWAPNERGPPAPRNRGIRKARGDLIAILDSDDVWEPRKLERQVAALEREPGLLAVSCNALYLPPRGRPMVRTDRDLRPSFEEMLDHNVVLASGTVVRREAIDSVGLFDPSLRGVEDFDLWLRILRHRERSILVLAEPLFHYRTSPDSLAPVGRREVEAVRRIFEKHLDFRGDAVRAALARRELAVRRGELREAFRAGTLTLREWMAAPEIPLRRRIRLAAKALVVGRARV